MVNEILVINTVVYDMQVWRGYILSKAPLKFMNSRTVFAKVCMKSMIGENWQLIVDKLVEVQDFKRITDHFRGIYGIYLILI